MNAVVDRPLAVITGASSGIGFELACECARNGFDLLVAADRPLDAAAQELKALGASVDTLQADLATPEGVGQLCARAAGRQVEVLVANAGHGLGGAFLDQAFEDITRVIDTNVTGTLALIHQIGSGMRERHSGHMLLVGSIAGYMPGTFQAVYNGAKAFIDSFSWALRNELKDAGVTVTCMMPDDGEMDPAEVARIGFKAMMDGEGDAGQLLHSVGAILPVGSAAEPMRDRRAGGGGHVEERDQRQS
jgi:short-subunit dehydrogenase